MPKLPTIAIIGRPNTGKSRLFNRLYGRRKAIVSDIPGTTRDHVAGRVEGDKLDYLLVDTGGMGGGTEDRDLEEDVDRQSRLALEHADLILFTVDSRSELTSADFEIVDVLRKEKKKHVPVILVVTKCDNPESIDEELPRFYELGIADEVIPISAPHKIGVEDLCESIEAELSKMHFSNSGPGPGPGKDLNDKEDINGPGPESGPDSKISTPRIAIIGRPNVGKSSIINAFMSESQREKSPLLVSDIAGTTRDATDTIIKYEGEEYVFIDTAGIRRRRDSKGEIETYAYFRSVQALEECDIAVLVVDGNQELGRQDKRIASMAVEEGKGLVILLNKTDLLSSEEKALAQRRIESELQFCKFATIIPCSSQTREGLLKLFPAIACASRNRHRRIADKELHRWFRDAVADQPVGSLQKSKHITQADEVPPTFVLFVRDPKAIQVSQLRYLENSIRKTFAFEGTPVRWVTKSGA